MNQTKAPKLTPSPRKVKDSSEVAQERSPSAVFVSMALDMSWRLAIAVLVPVIAGTFLDKHFKSGHLYLLLGFVVALLLAAAVVYQTYKTANSMVGEDGGSKT